MICFDFRTAQFADSSKFRIRVIVLRFLVEIRDTHFLHPIFERYWILQESRREREREMTRFTASHCLQCTFRHIFLLYTCAFEKMKSASLAAHLFILDIHDIYEKYKNVEQRGQYASIDSLRAIIYEPLLILEIFVLDASMKRLSGRE